MKRLSLALAIVFASLSPMLVVCGAFSSADAVLVFNVQPEAQKETVSVLPKEEIMEIVGELPMYMTPSLDNPLAEIVFGSPEEEKPVKDEEIALPDTEGSLPEEDATDKEYDNNDADSELDKGFVSSGVIDTTKPTLQKPSGTLATGSYGPSKYKLTDEERDLVERVIMKEVSGKSRIDALAVAQCIYDRVTMWGGTVEEIIFAKNAFADPTYKYEPTQIIKDAVSDIFDDGERLTVEPLLYFYATRTANPNGFHETQRCLIETDLHRYFGPWEY